MRPGDHGDSRCALPGRPPRPGRPRPAHSSRLFLAPPTGPALGASRLGRLTAWAPLGRPSRPAHHAGAFGPTFPVNPFSAPSPPGVLGRRRAAAATVRPVAATLPPVVAGIRLLPEASPGGGQAPFSATRGFTPQNFRHPQVLHLPLGIPLPVVGAGATPAPEAVPRPPGVEAPG